MASKRTYGDVCGVARALDLVGERWTLLILRSALYGVRRFDDFRADLDLPQDQGTFVGGCSEQGHLGACGTPIDKKLSMLRRLRWW